jgi:glycosyltransferase involved in cell wall biosynthesis
MGRRLRILVSTPSFLPVVGGAELGIHELYSRIGQRHDVTIVTPPPCSDVVEAYGANDYTERSYRVEHLMPVLDRARPRILVRALRRLSLPYLLRLAHIARQDRADVVNFHFVRPHGLALIGLRRLFRVPVVLSLVGRSDVLGLLSRPQRHYAKAVIANANEVVAISSYCAGGNAVIPYGVDTAAFSPDHRSEELRAELGAQSDDLLLLTVQRLAPIKRVDVLLQVMARVIVQDRRVILVVGGQGEEESRLRAIARDLSIEDNVRFVGYISSDRLAEYFASADVFVFHSLLETFGIVFAQAMASGLPIVAASTSCVPAVVYPENGELVQPFDIQAFADAVLKLARDADLRGSIGVRNRARAVEEFDWNKIAEAYENVLLSAAGHTDVERGLLGAERQDCGVIAS